MSRLTIAAAAFVIAASPIAAQDAPGVPSERVLELRAEMDRLRPLVEEARAARSEREAETEAVKRVIAAGTTAVDTFTVGLMTVLTPAGRADFARDILEEVWETNFSHIDRSPAVENARFEFQWGAPRVPIYVPPEEHRVSMVYPLIEREQMMGHVRAGIADVLHYDVMNHYDVMFERPLRPNVGRWAPENVHFARSWLDIYRRVAMTPSIASRDCLDGDVAACKSALGLGLDTEDGRRGAWEPLTRENLGFPGPTDQRLLETWYEPEERRQLVETNPSLSRYRSETYRHCVRDGDQASCDRLLVEADNHWVPFHPSIRTSLLALAIEGGGVGAWGRLIDDPTMTPEEVLEHVSGEDLDALVAQWRDRVVAAQTPAHGSLIPNGALATLWIFLFAALAVRSTRWRLG